MDQIRLKNYRCFRDEQTARLAPLTLLVGENSTGKTSFLAMVRVLWDIAYLHRIPDFKEDPYDLGSFDEIAHYRGGKGGRANTFEAGFGPMRTYIRPQYKSTKVHPKDSGNFSVTFGRMGTVPVPERRYFSRGEIWADENFKQGGQQRCRIGTSRGSWDIRSVVGKDTPLDLAQYMIRPLFYFFRYYRAVRDEDEENKFVPVGDSPEITRGDLEKIEQLTRLGFGAGRNRPYASAPVRSKPRRTYDPARSSPDPEGDHVPMYLASLYFQNKKKWETLKNQLGDFGKTAGLFDDITIKQLGRRESDPFQVQVKKSSGRHIGPWRNVIDVGYGVSQVLPLLTELLRPNAPPIFLLQQPEVHLHPSAQAALGSLFCEVSRPNRQLIVETHSDHILDRVRMDIRDGRGKLKPADVSILFFERGDLDVTIHSLRLDENGNILNAPDSYRRFFMEEMTRSLG